MSGAARPVDLYAAITDQIVGAIEKGAGDFVMPWHRARGSSARPWNVASSKRYQGINVLSLWLAAEAMAFPHPLWGTYRQWQAKNAQVRRGERASLIVFYKQADRASPVENADEPATRRAAIARASHVFNVAQVEGFAVEEQDIPAAAVIDPIESADALVKATGAEIREGGDRAFYHPREDFIAMPDRGRFAGSPTMSPTESYYATLLHEVTHWSGGEKRLQRNLTARFGENAYAMEELVAELGASYLSADLGVTTALRPDHGAYIAAWLRIMRADNRAVFAAAARAQEAATYLLGFAPEAVRLPTIIADADETQADGEGLDEGGPHPTRPLAASADARSDDPQ